MSVIQLLSSSLGQKGSDANIQLAKEIASTNKENAVQELVQNLMNKNKNIQSDCIKTLYETGYLNPELIAGYAQNFLSLLSSKNNRLVWGSMIALGSITDIKHNEIFDSLDLIMETVNKGSVITIDNGIEILARLNKYEPYINTIEPLLTEQLWKCPVKQLPQYMEKTMVSIRSVNKSIYQNILEKRIPECENAGQLKRLEKCLKQLNKLSI